MTLYVPGPAILFAPAGRPDIIPKAAAKADMVILDLEDGAGDIDRDQAYRNIRAANLDPQATIVRIVGPTDPNFAADLEFVRTTSYTTVMVPKVYADLPAGLDGLNIIAMIETPQAVVNIHKIAEHPQVVALFWGAEDLTMGLGGTHSRHLADEPRTGSYRDTSDPRAHAHSCGGRRQTHHRRRVCRLPRPRRPLCRSPRRRPVRFRRQRLHPPQTGRRYSPRLPARCRTN